MKTKSVTIGRFLYDIFVITDDDITFGFRINIPWVPTEQQILEIWNQHYKNFWIETEIEIIYVNGVKPKKGNELVKYKKHGPIVK